MEEEFKEKFQDDMHWNRRKHLIEKHQEIRELLNARDPSFLLVTTANVLTHLGIAFWLNSHSYSMVFLFAIGVGPLFHTAIFNALHEAGHDNAIAHNIWKWIGKPFLLFINLSLLVPTAPFYFTHKLHHAYMGTVLDVKFPTTEKEYELFDKNPATRILFLLTHSVIFSMKTVDSWWRSATRPDPWFQLGSMSQQFFFTLVILWFCGPKPLIYLGLSGYVNGTFYQGIKSLQDHWVDEVRTHTDSYYGFFNLIMHNIGYHREHHDFPSTPGRYLPMITKLAGSFYMEEDLDHVASSIYGSFLASLRAPPGDGLRKHAPKLPIKDQKS